MQNMQAIDGERLLKVIEELHLDAMSLRAITVKAFTKTLGETSAEAIIFHLGEDAFSSPRLLLQRLDSIFGSGTALLLRDFVDSASR